MEPQALYIQLQALISSMPQDLSSSEYTPEKQQWLSRAVALVRAGGNRDDIKAMNDASRALSDPLFSMFYMRDLMIPLYNTLAWAELNSPASARGGFIAVGARFDAFQAISKVLYEAKCAAFVIDPYMDEKVLTDFVVTAPEVVTVQLLADSHSTKSPAIEPAGRRWIEQLGSKRPLEIRLSPPRALHDRLIVIDSAKVWSLTQSLKDFASRSPASVTVMPPDIGRLKIDFYADVWSKSESVVP